MIATGSFEVKMTAAPPYSEAEGITLARAQVDRTFFGGLQAQSRVEMLGARTAVVTSAGYVAMELVEGELDGKRGRFVLQHSASMFGGKQEQSVIVVPDSASGALVGLRGEMTIAIVEGQHNYRFEFCFESER